MRFELALFIKIDGRSQAIQQGGHLRLLPLLHTGSCLLRCRHPHNAPALRLATSHTTLPRAPKGLSGHSHSSRTCGIGSRPSAYSFRLGFVRGFDGRQLRIHLERLKLPIIQQRVGIYPR